MTTLWSKELRKGPAVYVDLFDGVPIGLEMQFIKWEQQLHNTDWKHHFLHMYDDAVKDNSTSNVFIVKGNGYMERQEWRKAMEMYNQALCFAEIGTPEISMLYAKRGFCFSHMKMYDEAIIDMDLALKMDLPVKWLPMLNEAQKNSEKLRTSEIANPWYEPKLSFEADRLFPCIANILEIKQNADTQQSNIVAKEDIDVGKTILVEESFVSISNGYCLAFCFTCLNMAKNFIPCSKCTEAMFCNEECAKRSTVHQISCGEAYHRMPTSIRFVVQSILEANTLFPTIECFMKFVKAYVTVDEDKTDEFSCKGKLLDYAFFLTQSTKTDLPMVITYQAYKTLMSMELIKTSFNTRTKQRFLMHLVGHHTMVLTNNSCGGFERNQDQSILATMGNVTSLFEHSCTPNLVHLTLGNREVLITIRPVKAGDRLCFDFWPDEDDIGTRKRLIRQQFGMDCNCRKCSPDSNVSSPSMAADPSFFFIFNYNKYFGDSSPALEQKCCSFLQKFKNKPWTYEIEIATKVYIQCLIDEMHRRISQ